ncbi:MAG: formylmethanofuran dehydrogenase subunit A [Promethearchaeota archaeon]|nr:MAG: formylmethanofuran dehydrogenase subunit A [Candidatus Lokiarchaeota archaeon]
MKDLIIKDGLVYDPLNDIDGEKKDIHIKDGVIVEKVNGEAKIIDAAGMIVMPGGVDIHSHIAGTKVNAGRSFRPDDKPEECNEKRTKLTRSGTGWAVPSTWTTGYRYARLGYTTVVEPALPLLKARHTFEEFLDIPIIDTLAIALLGNNWFVMEYVKQKNYDKLAAYIAWILKAVKSYGVKIVNPGGVENWTWGKNVSSLDDHVFHFDVSPREILEGLSKANESLRLPHTIHVHANNLGHPGNKKHTLETFEALKKIQSKNGRDSVIHLTHCQFNAYSGTNWGDFASGAADIAEYLNSNKHVTVDMGQVIFGKAATTTMTADGPWEYSLHHIGGTSSWGARPGMKWINGQVEGESGSGIVPYQFSPKVAVNAVQWAIGLELALLIKNPWQVFMTTDHPNGGPFTSYPQIIRWLMDKKSRDDVLLNQCSKKASERTQLKDIDRELTLSEICTMTRAGTAKCLGMTDRGHLGAGAIGDVALYNLDLKKMDGHAIEKAFSLAAYTIKDGQIVVKDGEITATPMGTTICAKGQIKDSLMDAMLEEVKSHWRNHYSINFNNYAVQDVYTPKLKIITPNYKE